MMAIDTVDVGVEATTVRPMATISFAAAADRVQLEYRAEKWPSGFLQERCDNKEIERVF
ncbi:MAG: hypothetical protein P4M09_08780 [Devosia sp.]|nr:hypothetical protein [Devosia sp.]